MDVWGAYCAGDAGSYGGSMRSPYYRDYEQFPYGSLEQTKNPYVKDPYSKVQEKCNILKAEKLQKKHCPFCKEQKKRPLITYMRKRQSRKHHESICEEDDEHAEEENEFPAEHCEGEEEEDDDEEEELDDEQQQHHVHKHEHKHDEATAELHQYSLSVTQTNK